MSKDRQYNYIYDALVDNHDDIAGIIAYSVYKRQKIEHISSFHNKHGRAPDDSELQQFVELSTSPAQIEFYRHEAEALTSTFLEDVLADDLEEREALFAARVHAELAQIRPNHKLDILKGAAGSLLFVIFTGVLYFAVWALSVSPEQIIEEIFDVEIEAREER